MMAQNTAELMEAAKAWFFPLSAFAFVVIYPCLLFLSIVYQGYKASRASKSPVDAAWDGPKVRQPKLRFVACKDTQAPAAPAARSLREAQCAQSLPRPSSASVQRNLLALLTIVLGMAFVSLTGSALNFVMGADTGSFSRRDLEQTQEMLPEMVPPPFESEDHGVLSTGCIATSAVAAGMLLAAVKYYAAGSSSFGKLSKSQGLSR